MDDFHFHTNLASRSLEPSPSPNFAYLSSTDLMEHIKHCLHGDMVPNGGHLFMLPALSQIVPTLEQTGRLKKTGMEHQ